MEKAPLPLAQQMNMRRVKIKLEKKQANNGETDGSTLEMPHLGQFVRAHSLARWLDFAIALTLNFIGASIVDTVETYSYMTI